jgi:hypothetical protein
MGNEIPIWSFNPAQSKPSIYSSAITVKPLFAAMPSSRLTFVNIDCPQTNYEIMMGAFYHIKIKFDIAYGV